MSTRYAEKWCQEHNDIPYFETSAKDGINVELAFQTIAQKAIAQVVEVSQMTIKSMKLFK